MNLAAAAPPTVDIDAIYARLKAGALPSPPVPAAEVSTLPSGQAHDTDLPAANQASDSQGESASTPDLVLIQRSYVFAGKTHTEEKIVPRHSAEAKLFLSTQAATNPDEAISTKAREPSTDPIALTKTGKPKRKLVLARRSAFEPVNDNLPVRTDLGFTARARSLAQSSPLDATAAAAAAAAAKKLNTVEKSALDWAAHVDREGLGTELEQAGKKKGAYGDRVRFLDRVEGRREEESRRARGVNPINVGGL